MRELSKHQRVHQRHLSDQSFPIDLIAAMAQEAEKVLAADGYLDNGMWNAAVGDAANHFARQVDLAAVVAQPTGLEVEQPHNGVYIAYLEEGQFLDFHVDEFGFGEANPILCLKARSSRHSSHREHHHPHWHRRLPCVRSRTGGMHYVQWSDQPARKDAPQCWRERHAHQLRLPCA
ncbi:hypothetical protein [Streptomyces sp. NPDC014744]|uniref:hypothetical protein n=1 Tax=Streptomyces sp. NPDC014744 TaxID=3364903 RepID=UPI0036F96B0D